MKVIAFLVAPLLALAACVSSSNRCLDRYTYSSEYNACLPPEGSIDAGMAVDASTPPADAGAAMQDAPGGDAATGLGHACNGASDCAGKASYCLKDPTANPTDPGICSIPQCTAADCAPHYACCDCSGGLLAGLKAWPVSVCAPASNKSDLVSVGCTCP